MRRVHQNNRITAPRSPEKTYYDRLLMWETLYEWGQVNVSYKKKIAIFRKWLFCFLKGPSCYTAQNNKLFFYLYSLSRIPKFICYFLLHKRLLKK